MAVVATKTVMNFAEVMAYYEVGRDWLKNAIDHHGFPVSFKRGRKYFFHRTRIDDWFYKR